MHYLRTDYARNRSERLLVYERYDPVRRPFRHLDEEAENDHRGSGQNEHRYLREHEEGEPFKKEDREEELHSPPESVILRKPVRIDPARRTGEDIHQSEEACDNAGCFGIELEAVAGGK